MEKASESPINAVRIGLPAERLSPTAAGASSSLRRLVSWPAVVEQVHLALALDLA